MKKLLNSVSLYKPELENFYEKYLSYSALMHIEGVNESILKDENPDNDLNPKFTNEEVRKYTRTNLFSLALKLRLSITRYSGENKYRLFIVSKVVMTCIILLTYFNALLQNIYEKRSNAASFVRFLKIISTIIGFKYNRTEGVCLANSLMPFIVLFVILAYDVYVIGIIGGLQRDIQRRIETIENADDEFRKETFDLNKDNEEEEEEVLEQKRLMRKQSDEEDIDSEKDEEFKDIGNLVLGADKEEAKLQKVDIVGSDYYESSKEMELALLDFQDRNEIKITALKLDDKIRLEEFDSYSTLEKLDLHRWNFYEFYYIIKESEEKNFKQSMLDKRKLKNRKDESSSDSDEEEDSDDEKKEEEKTLK